MDDAQKGLGAHLYTALKTKIPIIGVAKNSFRGSKHAIAIYRGESKSPLFVNSCGMANDVAAALIKNMTGPYRVPRLLKQVDQLCRDWNL